MIFNLETRIGFLDDDESYLNSLQRNFKKYRLNASYYTNYQNFFNKVNNKNLCDFDSLEDLKNIMLSNEKDLYYGVVVVDQNMPNINGLEVLEEIKSKNIYKILNTGYPDDKIAIKAFNEKKIDFFLAKENNTNDLYHAIKEGEKHVLAKISSTFLQKLSNNEEIKSILQSKYFMEYFDKIIKQKNIKEYCAMDLNGYYRMPANGKVYTMLIMNNDSLSAQIEVLENMGANEEIIDEVGKGKRMLYLPLLNYDNFDANKYQYYLFPCEFTKDNKYAVSLIKRDVFMDL
jgi:FixJ family two-component response regulator